MTDPSRMWDRRFADQGWPAEPDPLLTELVAPLPAGRALDIGSGPGPNSLWLAAGDQGAATSPCWPGPRGARQCLPE